MDNDKADDLEGRINELTTKLADLEKRQNEQANRIDPLWGSIVQAEEKAMHLTTQLTTIEEKFPAIDSWTSSMEGVLKSAEEKFASIQEHFKDYFTRGEDPAKKSKYENVLEHHDQIEKLIQTIDAERKEINDFKMFVHGDGTESNIGFKKGIENEHEAQNQNAEMLYKKHEESFNTMYDKIEGLVEGATTIGLAKSFLEQKKSYTPGVIFYTIGFFLPVVFMIVYAVSYYDEPKTLEDSLRQIIFHLPLYGACIWLALFSGKKLNQNRRLSQEYAFKETLAKAYEGHLREIQKLPENENKNELLRNHLEIMIYTSAFNPSSTLESKSHDEKGPFFVDWFSRLTSRFQKKTGGGL